LTFGGEVRFNHRIIGCATPRRATQSVRRATQSVRRATQSVRRATQSVRRATQSVRRATQSVRRATRSSHSTRSVRDLHMDVSITSYNYQDNAMHLLYKLYWI